MPRIIIYGVGAIGGVLAAALAQSGQEVVGIARGRQLDLIRSDGLLLRTPDRVERARFACVGDPTELAIRPDDTVLLTMKSQDTPAALDRLREAGVAAQPVFCVQNGVANERMALRRFPNVHGVTVMMPASYLTPGEVMGFGGPRLGIFEIGLCPQGTDGDDTRLAAALEAANIACFPTPEIMAGKFGKLLLNLGNIVEAALGHGVERQRFLGPVRAEAEAVLAAAGIPWRDVGPEDARRAELMRVMTVPGRPRSGSSSTQSLARGTGSLETDYLNGEIVLLGRLNGVPTPANAYLVALAARLLRDAALPGAISPGELAAGLEAAGVRLGA